MANPITIIKKKPLIHSHLTPSELGCLNVVFNKTSICIGRFIRRFHKHVRLFYFIQAFILKTSRRLLYITIAIFIKVY